MFHLNLKKCIIDPVKKKKKDTDIIEATLYVKGWNTNYISMCNLQ